MMRFCSTIWKAKKYLARAYHQLLPLAVAERAIYPVIFGSALNGIGMQEVLDTINNLLPRFTPLDKEEASGDPSGEPSGIVFKVARQNVKTGRVCMIKLTAGEVQNRGLIGENKVTGGVTVASWTGGTRQSSASWRYWDGDGASRSESGATPSGKGSITRGVALGTPTLKVKVQVDRPTQRRELLEALTVIADNDPYLSYELNEFNDDIYITIFGYVQMEIVQEMLRRRLRHRH